MFLFCIVICYKIGFQQKICIQSQCSLPTVFLCSPTQQPLDTLNEDVSLYLVLQQMFELVTLLGYTCQQMPSLFSFILCLISYFNLWTLLYCIYSVFTRLYTVKLTTFSYMHSIHCSSSYFPYQVLERRQHKRL